MTLGKVSDFAVKLQAEKVTKNQNSKFINFIFSIGVMVYACLFWFF